MSSVEMSRTSTRVTSIDVMRGIFLINMMLVHFTENLSPIMQGHLYYDSFKFFAEVCLGAHGFAFVAGFSAYLSMSKHSEKGYLSNDAAMRYVKRGIFLFFAGLFFATIAWGFVNIFDWDILTLLGFSMITLACIRNLAPRTLIFMAMFVVALSPWLREWFGFFDAWDDTVVEYNVVFKLPSILRGFLIAGYFPIFPWIVFPIFGFATAKALYSSPNKIHLTLARIRNYGILLFVFGGISMIFAKSFEIPWGYNFYFSNWTIAWNKYPTTTTFIIFGTGCTLLLFSSLYNLFDSNPLRVLALKHKAPWLGSVVRVLSRYSAFSLTVYMVHQCIMLWILYIVGYVKTGERLGLYAKALPFFASFSLACFFSIFFYYILVYWESKKGKYSLEWLMTKVVDSKAPVPSRVQIQ